MQFCKSEVKVIADGFEIQLWSIMYLLMARLLLRLYQKTTVKRKVSSDLELRLYAWILFFFYLFCPIWLIPHPQSACWIKDEQWSFLSQRLRSKQSSFKCFSCPSLERGPLGHKKDNSKRNHFFSWFHRLFFFQEFSRPTVLLQLDRFFRFFVLQSYYQSF